MFIVLATLLALITFSMSNLMTQVLQQIELYLEKNPQLPLHDRVALANQIANEDRAQMFDAFLANNPGLIVCDSSVSRGDLESSLTTDPVANSRWYERMLPVQCSPMNIPFSGNCVEGLEDLCSKQGRHDPPHCPGRCQLR
jgi:hypothetical protein